VLTLSFENNAISFSLVSSRFWAVAYGRRLYFYLRPTVPTPFTSARVFQYDISKRTTRLYTYAAFLLEISKPSITVSRLLAGREIPIGRHNESAAHVGTPNGFPLIERVRRNGGPGWVPTRIRPNHPKQWPGVKSFMAGVLFAFYGLRKRNRTVEAVTIAET